MITPLITKLQNCTNSSELQSIYSEILSEYENINFPSEEFKVKIKNMLTESIETFIREFDSEYHREANKNTLESLKLLTSL